VAMMFGKVFLCKVVGESEIMQINSTSIQSSL